MHHVAASVPNDFEEEAASRADQKAPCLVADAKYKMSDEEESEDDKEDTVAGQSWDIVEVSIFDGARR